MRIVDKRCATYFQSDLAKTIHSGGQTMSEKYEKTEQNHV